MNIKEKGEKLIVTTKNFLPKDKVNNTEWYYYRKIFDQVVRDILDGKVNHDQERWHCGSAHCVFGWFEIKTMDPKIEYYAEKDEAFVTIINGNEIRCCRNALVRKIRKKLKIASNAEVTSHLTGYDVELLKDLFRTNNKISDIRRIAGQLGIRLTPVLNVSETIKEKSKITQSVSGRL